MKKRLFAVLAALSLGAATPPDTDWPHHAGQFDEAGHAALTQITRANVSRLGLAWSLDLPGEQSLEATPLAVGGALYFTGAFSDVYAVSVRTGKLLWKHEARVWEHNPAKMNHIFPLNRGCAHADGRIFSGTTDGRLIALDAKTGKLLWSVETVDRDDRRTITGAPRVFKGLVIIGHGGGDAGQRGYVTAYDQTTGRQVWRFYTVPGSPEENRGDPAMELAAKTWGGEYWKTGTGGTAWNAMTFARNWIASTLAPAIPGRTTRKSDLPAAATTSTSPPSTLGAHNWQAMAFNPQTGLVYVPYIHLGMRFTKAPDTFLGVVAVPELSGEPNEERGALIAWDPVAQKARWTKWHRWLWNGGALSTAGGLVFQGTADGWLTAYDAESGEELWRFDAGLGIVAPPISYSWRGVQYVSLLVGWVGPNPYGMGLMPTGWRYNAQPRRLLTFRLGGKAKLPPTAPYDETVHPIIDPGFVPDPARVAAGRPLFAQCSGCHGKDGQSSGAPGPDLRESALLLDADSFRAVVHEGALLPRGMPRFPALDDEKLEHVRHFLRAMAHKERERSR